jgi:hypothetical protein
MNNGYLKVTVAGRPLTLYVERNSTGCNLHRSVTVITVIGSLKMPTPLVVFMMMSTMRLSATWSIVVSEEDSSTSLAFYFYICSQLS